MIIYLAGIEAIQEAGEIYPFEKLSDAKEWIETLRDPEDCYLYKANVEPIDYTIEKKVKIKT